MAKITILMVGIQLMCLKLAAFHAWLILLHNGLSNMSEMSHQRKMSLMTKETPKATVFMQIINSPFMVNTN